MGYKIKESVVQPLLGPPINGIQEYLVTVLLYDDTTIRGVVGLDVADEVQYIQDVSGRGPHNEVEMIFENFCLTHVWKELSA